MFARYAILTCLALAIPGRGAAQAVLMGYVRDDATGRPIPEAVVEIRLPNGTRHTDRQGQYRFEGIPPRTLQVTVRYVGYETITRFVRIAPQEPIQGGVIGSAQTVIANFRLVREPHDSAYRARSPGRPAAASYLRIRSKG